MSYQSKEHSINTLTPLCASRTLNWHCLKAAEAWKAWSLSTSDQKDSLRMLLSSVACLFWSRRRWLCTFWPTMEIGQAPSGTSRYIWQKIPSPTVLRVRLPDLTLASQYRVLKSLSMSLEYLLQLAMDSAVIEAGGWDSHMLLLALTWTEGPGRPRVSGSCWGMPWSKAATAVRTS